MTEELLLAIHLYLARTPARVMTVQLEDLLGQSGQMNLPGTTGEHPNWRRQQDPDLRQACKNQKRNICNWGR
jgi:(1->4)-alpha-D-glucan 1-alpha-D-glucosylmutase